MTAEPRTYTEWALRAGPVVMPQLSEAAARRQHTESPDAELVNRTVTIGPWTVVDGAGC
jgi:hypothetical protein